jgi:hypothetical protein
LISFYEILLLIKDIFSWQKILFSLNVLSPQAVESRLQLKMLGFLLPYALMTFLMGVFNLCFSDIFIVVLFLFGGYKTLLQL